MAPEPILDRVKRLLALAQSDNEHEAALALSRAEQLMAEHCIEQADLGGDAAGEIIAVDATPLYSGARIPAWVSQLAMVVAANTGCFLYLSRREQGLIITGTQTDREACRAMFTWIEGAIRRLSVLNCKGKGRSYASSWCLGAAIGIRDTLEAAKRVREAEAPRMREAGLITLDKAKQARAVAEASIGGRFRTTSSRSSVSNGSAFGAGRETGRSISTSGHTLNGARGSLGMR